MDISKLTTIEFFDHTEKSFNLTQNEAISFIEEELKFWKEVYLTFENDEHLKNRKFISASNYLERAKNELSSAKNRESLISELQNLKHNWIHSKHSFVPAYIEHAKNLDENALNGFYIMASNQNTGTIPTQQFFGMILGYEFINQEAPIGSRISKEQGKFHTFMAESKSNIQNRTSEFEQLKNKYEEILILEAPATFWEKSAKNHKCQGFFWAFVLMGLISIGMIQASQFYIAWLTGTTLKLNINTLEGAVILGVIAAFFGMALKVFSKLALSSFHLMRDSQERELLTRLYLSLNKDNQVDASSREIVLQSLFSRADSGLLSGDSSPTLPGGIHELIKAMQK